MSRGVFRAPQRRRRSGENDDIVLAILQSANRPKGAYEIAEIAVRNGINIVPNQVYRTLNRLIDKNVVLRIESLNAYIPKRAAVDLCLICSQCHAVELIEAPSVKRAVGDLAAISHFELSQVPLEAQGRCSGCCRATIVSETIDVSVAI